ncbi:helix-turn-helix transcriptional regulator [Halegenticoccus soli]|uniref:helix-turn-helix transcriptional regulator n=1 Tax=Halegenticoccus soli TaxID=1985678 RepID=UPI000C6D52FF|nr:MarR family transcriptional regulator [Halegenticoccus soli]
MSHLRRLADRLFGGADGGPGSDGRTTAAAGSEKPTPESVEEPGASAERREGQRSPAELLLEEGATPAEYLLRLIELNGGRAQQKTLVEEARVSASTASRTLSHLEREGAVTRHRIGRRNLVCLPGNEPGPLSEDPDRSD